MSSRYCSENERRRRLDEECMKKYGHPFLKPYETGDEHRFFLPERSCGAGGYMVYHRYKHYEGQTTCHAYLCYCSQGGRICPTCAPLNTTTFFDLDVPLDVERFLHMKRVLQEECRMSDTQIYNWLSFWMRDVIPKRYSHDLSTPIFFSYCVYSLRQKIDTPYSFMSFLYEFVHKKHFKKGYGEFMYDQKASFVKVSHDSVKIRTVKALIKWSIDVYSHNSFIIRCETCVKKGRCSSVFWHSSDAQYDRSLQQWKKRFKACITQIRDEVAYRPGKVGMCDARNDFEKISLLLV